MQDSPTFSVESDHSSLLWCFSLPSSSPHIPAPAPRNPLRKIKRWKAFQDILDARLSSRQDLFTRMTGREQALFIAEELRKSGSSVLPAPRPGSHKPRPLSQKLSRLLRASKQLRRELKLSLDRSSDSFLALRAQARLVSQKVHSQHYIESLHLKRL